MAGKFKKSLGLGAGLLNEESKALATNDFQIKYIPIEELIENDKNEGFSIEDIEELKTSIEEIGLEQNLVVTPDDGSKYRILTGHRRYIALKELVAEGKTKFKNVPCVVKDLAKIDLPLDEETKELYAIATTNAEIRKNTDADRLKIMNMLSEVYDKLKASGYKKLGLRREYIAERMGVSSSTVHRLTFIDKNLNKDIKEQFLDDKLPLKVATEISKMDSEQQNDFIEHIDNISDVTVDDVKEFIKDSHDIIEDVELPEDDDYEYVLDDLTNMVDDLIKDMASDTSKLIVLNKAQYAKVINAQKKIEQQLNLIKKVLKK